MTDSIDAVNGTTIADRVCAVDVCLPKNAYVQQRDEEVVSSAPAAKVRMCFWDHVCVEVRVWCVVF